MIITSVVLRILICFYLLICAYEDYEENKKNNVYASGCAIGRIFLAVCVFVMIILNSEEYIYVSAQYVILVMFLSVEINYRAKSTRTILNYLKSILGILFMFYFVFYLGAFNDKIVSKELLQSLWTEILYIVDFYSF